MKHTIHVDANDGDTTVKVTVVVSAADDCHAPDELAKVKQDLARAIADGIRGLTYTSFGPENTQVRL